MTAHTFTTSDGVRIAYWVEGSGADDGGPSMGTVVLVSGYGAPAPTWHFQREGLVAAGFEVVTVDRRHTGESDFPDFGLRLSRQAADVHELLAHLGRGDVGIVGHSMGASMLYALFDTFGTAGISRACVVDQTPKMINEDGWEHGFYGLTWETVGAWTEKFPDGLNAFHDLPPQHVLEFLATLPQVEYPFAQALPLLRDHATRDWRDVVPRIGIPLLVLGGRHSPTWPVAHAEWVAANAPQAELVIFEKSGHAPPLEEPELVTETLVDFFRR